MAVELVGTTIACGGVAVRAGDIIIADRDGVTVVPLVDAGEVARLSADKVASELKRSPRSKKECWFAPRSTNSFNSISFVPTLSLARCVSACPALLRCLWTVALSLGNRSDA